MGDPGAHSGKDPGSTVQVGKGLGPSGLDALANSVKSSAKKVNRFLYPVVLAGACLALLPALSPFFFMAGMSTPNLVPLLAKAAGTGLITAASWEAVKTLGKKKQCLEDFLRHIYLIGATGSGKTSKILSDIFLPWIMGTRTTHLAQKPGALIIETKDKESVDDILNVIPPSEHRRVIIFDPYDMVEKGRYIGLNVLEPTRELLTAKTLTGGETISVFGRIFDGFIGPSSEDILRNITLANLDQAEQATILEDYRMIKDAIFRGEAVPNIQNPVLRDYFANNFPDPAKNTAMFNPPLNKLRSFLTDNLALNIMGQKSGINFRAAIEEGMIMVFCLPKGLIGEPLSRLLATIALSKTQLAAFSRANIPKAERLQRPFMVICDEFQDYANASFNVFLEQARSMAVSLVLSHQLLSQKGVGEDMIESIAANVGTKYIFAVGMRDAAILARELNTTEEKPFPPEALVRLPNFTCVAKKIVHGKRTEPSVERSPLPPKKGNWAEALRQRSLMEYGVPEEEIRSDIDRRLTYTASAESKQEAVKVVDTAAAKGRGEEDGGEDAWEAV